MVEVLRIRQMKLHCVRHKFFKAQAIGCSGSLSFNEKRVWKLDGMHSLLFDDSKYCSVSGYVIVSTAALDVLPCVAVIVVDVFELTAFVLM